MSWSLSSQGNYSAFFSHTWSSRSFKLINPIFGLFKRTCMERFMHTLMPLWRMWEQKSQYTRNSICKSSHSSLILVKCLRILILLFPFISFFQINHDNLVIWNAVCLVFRSQLILPFQKKEKKILPFHTHSIPNVFNYIDHTK